MAAPAYGLDNIIGIKTGSFTVTAPTAFSFKTATDPFDTGFGTTCLFQGIFSTDGGTTWNDFGSYTPDLTTPGSPVFQTVTCRGYVTSGGVFTAVGINWYDNVHLTGTSKTIQYKVVFLAKKNQGIITPIATNETLYYKSSLNYQKIYLQDTFAVSTVSSTPVAHNLGYVPKVRAWFTPTNATSGNEGVATIPAGALTTLDWFSSSGSGDSASVQVDTANVTFTTILANPAAQSGTQEYRIYLDA